MARQVEGINSEPGQPPYFRRPIEIIAAGAVDEDHRWSFIFLPLVSIVIEIGCNGHKVP